MFETLSDRFDGILKRLRGKGKLSEADVDEVLKEIRVALLEADVALSVARDLVERIRVRAIGAEVSESLSPAQQVIKIVNEELTVTLGGETFKLTYASKPPTVVLLAGLQGSGKTTTSAKLARWFKQQGRNPLLIGADLQRPAAVEQLRTLGASIDVPVFSEPKDPVKVAKAGMKEANRLGRDVVIVDTAGRLAIDQEMMSQVRDISKQVKPDYTFLVVDAMTGQDAVTMAQRFNQDVGYDGIVLTKLDGDARGGAALSIRTVTGKPIVFCGVGERTDALEAFHPDRMASRILGMGDVLSLVEKAQATVDASKAEELAQKIREDSFTLEDFAEQLRQLRKMGPLDQILDMVPFLKGAKLGRPELDAESQDLKRFEAIIGSMTPGERQTPAIINGERRARIARGSGTSVQDVNRLLKQYAQLRKMMKDMKGMSGRLGRKDLRRAMPFFRG